MERVLMLLKKYQSILSYLFFGALTTAVNFLVYFPMFNWLRMSAFLSNIIAWAAAVCFAFFTNKPFVFSSHDWSAKTVMDEALKFVGCRLGSGLFETVTLWLLVDVLAWNGNLMKVIVSIFVVVLNYIFSKWIVFKR